MALLFIGADDPLAVFICRAQTMKTFLRSYSTALEIAATVDGEIMKTNWHVATAAEAIAAAQFARSGYDVSLQYGPTNPNTI